MRKKAFLYHLPLKHLTTMITGWLSIVLSFTILRPIPGSSIFTTIVQTHFLSGSVTGGHDLDAVQQSYQLKQKKVGIFGRKISTLLSHIQKKSNFSEPLTSHGFSVGNTDYKIIYSILFHCRWFEFTKLNGGMNSRQNYMAKRMWSIFGKQKQRSSLSTISIHLIRRKKLLLDPLAQSKEKVQQLLPRQELKDCLKRNKNP